MKNKKRQNKEGLIALTDYFLRYYSGCFPYCFNWCYFPHYLNWTPFYYESGGYADNVQSHEHKEHSEEKQSKE